MTDFEKQNQGIGKTFFNSACGWQTFSTTWSESRAKNCHSMLLDERMGRKKDPREINEHTRRRRLRAVSEQDLAADVQPPRLLLQRPSTGWTSTVDLGPHVEAFHRQCPFPRAWVIVQHVLPTVFTVKNIVQRVVGINQFSRPCVPYVLSDSQKPTRAEAASDMLRIL
jgi:hypothetical protein